jgi:transposase InsO family protein
MRYAASEKLEIIPPSKHRTSPRLTPSLTPPRPSTSSGKPTSPTSRSSATPEARFHQDGWVYLSTVLDDFSRYIVAWKLYTTMAASDVTATLDLALQASGLDHTGVACRPRLLSGNGPSYVADDLADWLVKQGMQHTRGKPIIRLPRARSSAGTSPMRARFSLGLRHLTLNVHVNVNL